MRQAGIVLTRDIAFAAGMDAANRAMRTRIGQHPEAPQCWTEAEADIATAKTNGLLLYVPFEKGGLQGLSLSPTQRADLLIADQIWQRATAFNRAGNNGGPALDETVSA